MFADEEEPAGFESCNKKGIKALAPKTFNASLRVRMCPGPLRFHREYERKEPSNFRLADAIVA